MALRRSLWHFLSGKAVSALLTFALLLWLVRLLPRPEYGAYVTLTAGLELGYALSSLGLPWLAARYIPEYRLHASGSDLASLCRWLGTRQLTGLVTCVVLMSTLLAPYLEWSGLRGYRTEALLFLLMLVVEGMARFLRDGMMGPLMLQGESRTSMVMRQLLFLVALAWLAAAGRPSLLQVAIVEASVSAVGLVLALWLLWRHLRHLQHRATSPGWQQPSRPSQWKSALGMYAAHLLTLTYSPQVLINLIQRYVGIESAAQFGFLRNLQEQIGRYLPATLLFNLIRPKLMASVVGDRHLVDLTWQANLAGKLSLFVLLPIVAGVAVAGDPLVTLLSGGKFIEGGGLLFGFMLALVPFSQRQLVESVAMAVGQARLCVAGSAVASLSVLLALALLAVGAGPVAGVAALFLGHAIFDVVVIRGVQRRSAYRADWVGPAKLAFAALLSGLAGELVALMLDHWLAARWLASFAALGAVILVYALTVWRARAFSANEGQSLDSLIGRRIFGR